MDTGSRYEESLQWIHGLGRFGIKPGLERVAALLARLGNPERLLSFVHIAGTNGKGSTAAILAAVLREAGYRTALYTSPYLLSFTNRMALDGKDIKGEELALLVEEVRPLVEEVSAHPHLGQPTEFEVVTVLALTHFARSRAEVVVLETGLGGRLDATNVVRPLVSVITNIGLEHTDVLGQTIPEIAAEKAGIIKEGVPALTASIDPAALTVIEARAKEMAAPLQRVTCGQDPLKNSPGSFHAEPGAITEKGQFFHYRGQVFSCENLFLPLRGRYQVCNAATALAALELLAPAGFKVKEEELRLGLAAVSWPGRLEILQEGPSLVLDGAHNPHASARLAEALPDFFVYDRLVLLFGAMADKDLAAIMRPLLLLADEVIFSRPALPRAAVPNRLAEVAVEELAFSREKIILAEDLSAALKEGLRRAQEGDLLLVTGSLYTVSELRSLWVASRAHLPGQDGAKC